MTRLLSTAVALLLVLLGTSGAGRDAAVPPGGLERAARAQGPEQAERWVPPLPAFDVTGPFRAPPHRYGSGHRGIDLAALPGDPVAVPAAGIVTYSGVVVDRPLVTVRVDPRTVYTIEPVESELVAGQEVVLGDTLGAVGEGGHCLRECVHLGVRVDGEYANPMQYFVDRPVLLPWDPGGEPG